MKKPTYKHHKDLYSKIPTFQCRIGCSDCCGPVPFSKWEWSKIQDKRKGTRLTCPYVNNGKCDIYEDRPLICRLFGASEVEMLTCPHGCGPAQKLSVEQTREMMAKYFEILNS